MISIAPTILGAPRTHVRFFAQGLARAYVHRGMSEIIAAVHAEFPGYPVSAIKQIVAGLRNANAYIENVLAEVEASLELEDVESLNS